MSKFVIEKDIPLPPFTRHVTSFPLGELEVGDSFLMPLVDRNKLTAQTTYMRKKGDQRKYTTRRIDENQMRVWRIK